ncbi:MAG: DUF6089 family protein [Prevotellaceae bacterium]|jgi:hypothetical protein|nr:DUF6089 family protein [Prevotellaceae bacterium]
MKIQRLPIPFLLATLAASLSVKAQKEVSIGGLVSASSYTGDFNPGNVMSSPGVYVGGVIRYAATEYYSLRVGFGGGNLRGNPSAYERRLMSNLPLQKPASFNQRFFDADIRVEIGFAPYEPFGYDPKKFSFSPYFALGVGGAYSRGAPFLQLPIAVGAKYRIVYRFTLGAEWTFRKTFNDSLDGWENVQTSSARTSNNNDWISYIGVYLTYQLSDKGCCHELKKD